MTKTNINFAVDKMAVLCNIMDAEIKARLDSKRNPDKKQKYKELGIIETTPAVSVFMNNHKNVFLNKKFIKSKGSNIFEEILPISSDFGKEIYQKEALRRLTYTYELEESEESEIEKFLEDFWELSENPEIKKIIAATNKYKDSIEEIWKVHEKNVIDSVIDVLGYQPESAGTVCTYIMYPNFNIHRTCQSKSNQTNLFFGKIKEQSINKIVAYLSHQVFHQPMLPYKTTMTQKQKEEFHGFIKFLTDKDVYNRLTGKSYLAIATQNENPEIMAKIYPYWLGYRYRNADKEGLDPVQEICKAIARDKKYFEKIPKNNKARKLYERYEFDKYDPLKIAVFFRERKGITPYQFAQIDFDNKLNIYKKEFLLKGNQER